MGRRQLTQQEFVDRARSIHGAQYDYSRTKYISTQSDVTIVCKKHGAFTQNANNHLNGKGCKKCAGENTAALRRIKNISHILKTATMQSGVTFNYDGEHYFDEIDSVCPKHGKQRVAIQRVALGFPCRECAKENKNSGKSNTKDFIAKCRKVHGRIYSYGKVEYINATSKVLVTCTKHGDFGVTPNNHLRGRGCPQCSMTFDTVVIGANKFVVRSKAERRAILWIQRHSNWDLSKLRDQNVRHEIVISTLMGGFIPDFIYGRKLVEVKSEESFGLWGNFFGIEPDSLIKRNQLKYKAAVAEGYKCFFLVMKKDGTRIQLPRGWENMKPALLRKACKGTRE